MPDEFKSWLGKKMSSEAAAPPEEEDFVYLGAGSELSKSVASDIAQLQGMINDQDSTRKGLEAIVKYQDPNQLIKLNEQLKSHFDILDKYSAGAPPIARISLGKRLDAARKLKEDVLKGAEVISAKLYETCRVKSDGVCVTDDLATLDSIRADINKAAKSYAALKKSFPELQPNAHLEDYLKRLPGITAVQEELARIEEMLAQDQSSDAFSAIKNERKKLRGRWFSGKLRKECENLMHKEGILRCDALYREIEGYVANFGQLKKLRSLLLADSTELRHVLTALNNISLKRAEAGAIDTVVSARKAVLAPIKSELLGYTFVKNAVKDSNDVREQLDKESTHAANTLCSLATNEIRQAKVPGMPQTGDELGKAAAEAKQMIQRTKELNKILTTFAKPEAELCTKHAEALNAFYAKCLEQQKAAVALEKKISGLNLKLSEANDLFTNPAFIEHDLAKAIEMMNIPQLDGLDYFPLNKARGEYYRISGAIKKAVREKIADGLAQLVAFYETPIQQTGDTGADATAIRSRVDKICTAVMPLLASTQKASITTDVYSQRLEKAIQNFNAQLSSIQRASEQRSELVERIGMMKVALQNLDEDRISAYSHWATGVPMTPYTSELAKEYISLVDHAKKVASEFAEKKPAKPSTMPMIPYSHEALMTGNLAKSKTFFAYVDRELKIPHNPALKSLRTRLLCGTIHDRLSALETTLNGIEKVPLGDDDSRWLSMLKDAYLTDVTCGYLSDAEQFNVPKARLQGISTLFEKSVRD